MKKTNRILSFLLALVMVFSAMSVSLCASAFEIDAKKFLANPADALIQAHVSDGDNVANRANATTIVNLLDEFLRENGEKTELDLSVTKLTIDLTTVNGLLKSVDMVADDIVSGLLRTLSGSLKTLKVDNWIQGQSREASGDLAVLDNIITFLIDNKTIVSAVVDGSFKLGYALFVNVDNLVKSTTGIDSAHLISHLLKEEDGLYGFVKKAIAKLIYPDYENPSSLDKYNYNVCINKTLDAIFSEDILGSGLNSIFKQIDDAIKGIDNEILTPVIEELYSWGFKLEGIMDSYHYNEDGNDKLTLDATIAKIADIVYTQNKVYLEKLLYTHGTELQNAIISTSFGAPFESLLNFDKFTEYSDYSFLDFTSTGSVKGTNKFVGQIIEGVTAYGAWSDTKNLGGNLESFFRWALDSIDKTGTPFENYDFSGDNTKYALALAQMIADSVPAIPEDVKEVLKSCKTAEEVVTKLVPNIFLDKDNNKIVGSKANTWEKVCGDILGYYLSEAAPLYTDTKNTVKYEKYSGKDLWAVLNYAANYYLIDLGIGNMLGVKLSKSDSFLSKLDKLQASLMTDLDYMKASTLIPAVCEAAFSLDFDTLVGKGIEEAFADINLNVSAANLAFIMIRNVFKGIFGRNVFTTEKFESLDKIIQNKELGATVNNILSGLGVSSRRAAVMPVVLYAMGTADKANGFTCTVGNDGAVTVKYGKEKLTKGIDYEVSYSVNEKNVSGTVKVTGTGSFAGTYYGVSNCVNHTYGSYKTTQKATCTSEGKKAKTCALCGKVYTKSIAKADHTAGTSVVTKKATTSSNGTVKTSCKVCGTLMKTETIKKVTSFKLSKTEMTYTGKALKPTVTVKDSSGKTLKSGTDYSVKYSSNTNVGEAKVTVTLKGKYSGTKTLKFKIVPKSTSISKLSGSSKAFNVTWKKQSTQTSGFEVQYSTSKKFSSSTTKTVTVSGAKSTTKTVSKLKAKTTYYVKVRAYKTVKISGKSTKLYSAWSSYKSVKTK